MPDRELATRDEHAWTQDQQRIIREQFADGCTDDELAVLLYQAKRRGLDPLLGQIRGIKRWNAQKGREVMAVQTSIDAFRLIADRTGKYGGGPAPEFRFEEDSKGDRDMVCRFTVRKLCGNSEAGWTWLDVTDEARFKEYCGRNKKGHLTRMWHDKPHVMLAKCAESKTLRRAFPEDLGHLFTDDEMQQADNPVVVAAADVTNPEKAEQVARTTVDRMRGGVGMVGEYPQGDAKVLSCADCGARVTYEEPH
jgi:phage recombination protein Bet